MNKCFSCIFSDIDPYIGSNTPICSRQDDLDRGLEACKDPNPCEFYVTRNQIKEYQDTMKRLADLYIEMGRD